MARQHINDEGEKKSCSTTPDKCDFSRNGDHLESDATPEQKAAFEKQAEKVAERAAGQSSAVGSGAKKAKKADPLENDGRMWIGENGQLVCSKHGGNYLRENITSAPDSPHHSTPLGTWVDVTNNPDVKGIPCEVCEEGG